MTAILKRLNGREFVRFTDLLQDRPDVQSICVWFLATLELAKIFLLSVQQAEPYGEIYLRTEEVPALTNAQADDAGGVLTAEGIFWRRRLMPGEQGTLFEDDIN